MQILKNDMRVYDFRSLLVYGRMRFAQHAFNTCMT